MDYSNRIKELRDILNKNLLPLIDYDYIYLDLPYHTNIGDTLIWEGTRCFLKQLSYKCLYSTNVFNYRKPNISKQVVIILHGGGNWGDLWPLLHEFRKKIVLEFPENKIVVLPQTVFYNDNDKLEEDVAFFSKYQNVTICARDMFSYETLSNSFSNKILLLPDMAFCITGLAQNQCDSNKNVLFVKRTDKELKQVDNWEQLIPQSAIIRDWPTMEKICIPYKIINKLIQISNKLDRMLGINLEVKVSDFCWKYIMRPYHIRLAFRFLKPYSDIYSTRLHVVILGILLGKKIYVLDNSYGKNINFIRTWFLGQEIDIIN